MSLSCAEGPSNSWCRLRLMFGSRKAKYLYMPQLTTQTTRFLLPIGHHKQLGYSISIGKFVHTKVPTAFDLNDVVFLGFGKCRLADCDCNCVGVGRKVIFELSDYFSRFVRWDLGNIQQVPELIQSQFNVSWALRHPRNLLLRLKPSGTNCKVHFHRMSR